MKNNKVCIIVLTVIVVVLVFLTAYFWKKSRKTKESLCLCGGAQIYKTCRDKDFAMYGKTKGKYGGKMQYVGMPYDIETNGTYTEYGSC